MTTEWQYATQMLGEIGQKMNRQQYGRSAFPSIYTSPRGSVRPIWIGEKKGSSPENGDASFSDANGSTWMRMSVIYIRESRMEAMRPEGIESDLNVICFGNVSL